MLTRFDIAGNRREFFRAAGRYGLAGLLLAVTAVVSRKPAPPGQKCVNQGICGGCGLLSSCGLPQALSVKAVRRGA